MAGGGSAFYRLLLAYIGFWYRLGIFRWRRLSGFRQWLDRRLITRFGLFDPDGYIFLNPDVSSFEGSFLEHFVTFGRAEKRRPHLLFDNEYYWSQVPKKERHMQPLIHFILFGQWRGWSPSPIFDSEYYINENTNLDIKIGEAFCHYFTYGYLQNLRPSSQFNPLRYIREHRDQISRDQPAVIHYLASHGDAQASEADVLRGLPRPRERYSPSRPSDIVALIRALSTEKPDAPVVDVVVPVYAGLEETLHCLYRVLSSENETPYRLVVVDDKSPEAELSNTLRQLSEEGYFSLIYHNENQGFVASVNDGMAFAEDTDVILLNSDTEVFFNWIDRLRLVAQNDESVSSVTPLTNNGTICGYPYAPQDNPQPLEISYEELDRLAWEANGASAVSVPTAVGFCMYIKRAALNQLGLFDVEAFGRGYGEENDFCLRAQLAGWVDVTAAGVFIRHLGSLSFTGEKRERVENALRVLDQRYPLYRQQVQEFLREDPLRAFRANIDLARLQRKAGERCLLLICHARGGGTEQHLREITQRYERDGYGVIRLVPAESGTDTVRLFHQDVPDTPSLPEYSLSVDQTLLVDALSLLNVVDVQIHHTVDFGPGAAAKIEALADKLGVRYSIMVHDYFAVCPRINMMDETGFYCGEPDVAGCNQCLQTRGSDFGRPEIGAWRAGFQKLFKNAAEVAAPSQDAADRISHYFPDACPVARPHEPNIAVAPLRRAKRGEPLRIGVVGAISAIKGYNVLLECAAHVRSEGLPVEFVVVGYTEDDLRAENAGIEVIGPYRPSELMEEIDEHSLDLIFLPSVWPETYSYVLSSALQTGLPIVVFDIGAPAERLKGVPQGLVLPLEMAKEPGALVKRLVEHAEIANVGGNPSN